MPVSAGDFLEQMNQQQHQSMLLQMMAGTNAGTGAESLAGGMLSRGAAVGKPLMSGAMGLMGLDPISMGIRAGTAAWSGGAGVLGAGMAGMGMMAGVGMAGAGVAYVGNQMMTGAQQQIGLNQGLRQNFNFMNNQGGMGFTSHQGYQIGDQLRGMAGVQGPGMEVATFGELSRLASSMGRMGLAQNVRTVAEFKEKFKQMVDTVKVIAHDMGTSLEEAQKMMASMKSSGVFGKVDALRMSAGIRQTAIAGGLAMSEVSGAANIGAQIARSVGGLGRQGAFAGVTTMQQIGVAQKVGALTEEDIYNATGLTGAEGRQALASSQMQQSAQFMKSSRGRYFLASVAGKNGTLNEQAVNEWLAGGDMSTGRTAELAHQNLAGVGRANFIRNEGHLRGAALEKFGGLMQSMVYKQWLSQRGFDPSSMDDRSMLAFQRFSGMGRDEADVAIKELQSMPEQIKAFQDSKRAVGMADKKELYRKTHGIEGMKRKYDEALEKVQAKFQEAGAGILEGMQNQMESWFNGLMGIYVDHSTEGLENIVHRMETLGAGKDFNRYLKGGTVGNGAGDAANSAAKMLSMQRTRFSVMAGDVTSGAAEFGKANADFMKQTALATVGMGSKEMLETFRSRLGDEAMSNPAAHDLLLKLNGAQGDARQMAIMSSAQGDGIVGKSGTVLAALDREQKKFNMTFTPGDGITEKDFRRNLGEAFEGREIDAGQRFMQVLAGGDDNTRAEAIGDLFKSKESREMVADMYRGSAEDAAEARNTARDKILSIRQGAAEQGKKLTPTEQGTVRGLATMSIGSRYAKEVAAWGNASGTSPAMTEKIVREYNDQTGEKLSEAEVFKRLKSGNLAGIAAMNSVNGEDYKKVVDQIVSENTTQRDNLVATGYMAPERDGSGQLTGKLKITPRTEADRAKMSPAAKAAAEAADRLLEFDPEHPTQQGIARELAATGMTLEQYEGMTDYDKAGFNRSAALRDHFDSSRELEDKFAKLDKGGLEANIRSGGRGGETAAHQKALTDRYLSAKGQGTDVGAMAKLLGMDLSEDEQKKIAAMKPAEQAAALSQKLVGGSGDKALTEGLGKALQGGTSGEKALGLSRAVAGMSEESKRKIQESKADKDDPSYRVLNEIKQQSAVQTKILGVIASQKPASAEQLAAIMGPEGKGHKPGGK